MYHRLVFGKLQGLNTRAELDSFAGVLGVPRLLGGERGSVAVAWAALLKTLLAACAPVWERLAPGERARVLAPAYMAFCHLVLYGETRRAYHAGAAEALALIALARVSDAGLGL